MSSSIDRPQSADLTGSVKNAALTVGGGVSLLWLMFVAQTLSFGLMDGLAIAPRTLTGLIGVLFAPLLHGSIGHIVGNTVGFAVLAPLTMLRKRMDFWVVTLFSAVSSGLGAWLLGASGSLHLGASGVIFGYLGFLMARGLFERRVGAILLSAVVTLLFGSMVFGIFPILAGVGVSWQAHMFGFVGGVGTARLLGTEIRKRS